MVNTSWSGYHESFPPKLRTKIMERDRICASCGVQPATEADHIVSFAQCLRDGVNPHTLGNGQGLCHECHEQKTKKQIVEGKARMKPRRGYCHPSGPGGIPR